MLFANDRGDDMLIKAFSVSEAEHPQGARGRWHEVLKWNGTPTGCWMRG